MYNFINTTCTIYLCIHPALYIIYLYVGASIVNNLYACAKAMPHYS